ncbi:2'-5' RNA ligase [Nitrospira sp.]|nr:2'-5' RNA ligase [Nitrospira sp.]
MIRVFLAVLLEERLKSQIASLQDSVKKRWASHADASVRIQWVGPHRVHLTLKFLGAIEEAQLMEIRQAVRPIVERARPMSLTLGPMGVFPDIRAPRVLWLGSLPDADASALVELAVAVDRALVPLGFQPEARPFRPHLTLARIKDGWRSAGQAFLRGGILERPATVDPFPIGAIHLMESELLPSGPRYTSCWSLSLGAAAGSS